MSPKHDPPDGHDHLEPPANDDHLEPPANDDHPEPPESDDHPGPPGGPPEEGVAREQREGSLFVVDYETDAQRKRAEYLFETWENGAIERPSGLVRIAENVDSEALHEALLVKFRAEQVEAYGLSEQPPPESPETRSVERLIGADRETVESFVGYLLSRKNGQRRNENDYEVYTRHGRADLTVSLEETDEDETTVRVRLRGHPPALEPLSTYLREELDAFEASRG